MTATVTGRYVGSLARLFGVAVALVVCSQHASAAEHVYNGSGGYWFDIPESWTPAGPPGSTDTALFNLDGQTNVFLRHSTTTNKVLKVEDGPVVLVFDASTPNACWNSATYELLGSGGFLNTAAVVGITPGKSTMLKLHGGVEGCYPAGYVTASGMLIAGQVAGSKGHIKLGEEYYGYEGPITWTSTAPTVMGLGGWGYLEIRARHTLINGSAVMASADTATGTADILGTWTNNGALTVGNAGWANIIVLGELSNTGDAYLGAKPGSFGEVAVRDTGPHAGDWFCHGSLYVGGDDEGSGGEGSVWINGGYARVWGDTTVWSQGSLEMLNGDLQLGDVGLRAGGEIIVHGGEFDSSDLHMFYGSSLTADGGVTTCTNVSSAGSIDVNGGTLNVANQLYNGSSSDITLSSSGTITTGTLDGYEGAWSWTSGTLNITNDSLSIESGEPLGADLQIVGHKSLTVSGTLNVGRNSPGTLTVGSGGTVESAAGVVGNPSSGASVALSSAGTSWTIDSTLAVRGTHPTHLSMADGATVTNNNAYLASDLGTTAQVSLTGNDTLWRCNASLYAGGDTAVSKGTGTLEVDAGAELIVDGTMKVWDDFVVEVDGGTITTEDLDITGEVVVLGSGLLDLSGGTLDIENGALLKGAIAGDGATSVALHDTGSSWTMPGSLSIGAGNYGQGHVHALSLEPGTSVTVDDHVSILNLFALNLNGGTINASSIEVMDMSFSDFGTINGDFSAAGSVSASGKLVVGDGDSATGVQIGGSLHVGPHDVTLNHQGVLFLHNSTSIAGGTLTVPGGFGLSSGDEAAGFGVMETPDDPATPLINDGSILGNASDERIELAGFVAGLGMMNNVTILGTDSPGDAGPASVDRGNVHYAGRVIVEIGGVDPGSEHDQINHEAAADLGGELIVELVGEFVPSQEDAFAIMTYADHTGQFDTLSLPSLPTGLQWEVNYGVTRLTLTISESPSTDCDLNGVVDLEEFGGFEPCLTGPDNSVLDGCDCFDVDDSGTVDMADFALFQMEFTGSN